MPNVFDVAESGNAFDQAERSSTPTPLAASPFDPSKIKLNPYDEYKLKYGAFPDQFGAHDTAATEMFARNIAQPIFPHIISPEPQQTEDVLADIPLAPLRAASLPFSLIPKPIMEGVENFATDVANVPSIGMTGEPMFRPGEPMLPKVDIKRPGWWRFPDALYNQLSEMTTPGNVALALAGGKAHSALEYARANPPSMALAKELSRATEAPLDIPETAPYPIRRLGIPMPSGNPFDLAEVQDLAGRSLEEAQGGKILAPGQEPALLALRRQFQPQLVEPQPIALADRPGGGPATGGQISFASPAEANAIPSARQAALEQPEVSNALDTKTAPVLRDVQPEPGGGTGEVPTQINGNQVNEGGNQVPGDINAQKAPVQVADPAPDQLAKYKETSGRVSWTPDYFQKAGDNVFNPDWWTGVFDKVAGDSKIDGTGTAYQIGKFIRSLGNDAGNRVIDALEQTREKMSADVDLIKKDFKGATPEQINRAMKWGTGGIQLPREAWEAALDIKSGKGELPGEPIVRLEKGAAQPPAAVTPEKPGLLETVDAKLAEWQNNLRNGKTFTGIVGIEPLVMDAALTAARAAIKATKSVIEGTKAALDYVRKNYPDLKFNEDEFKQAIADRIRQPEQATTPTAQAAAAPQAASAAPAARTTTAGLDDIYKIFEPEKKQGPSLGQRVSNIIEAVRTGVSSRFRPIEKLAEEIGKAYGVNKKGIAGIFEQLKGSTGKAEADVYQFDKDVSDLVKGNEKDFSVYMFLRRGLDRLAQDVTSGESRRKVGSYSAPELQAKLNTLEQQLGPEKLQQFQTAADNYQKAMDQALRLQVDSGRMSPEVYDKIKSENQFYAPFKVMKYLEETMRPEGTGRKVDTVADYTKAMEGIESEQFKLGDMLAAGRQNILLSRILADKNYAMRKVADLAAVDTNGLFIKKLFKGQTPPRGMETVNVMESGVPVKYAVNPDVAESLQIFGQTGANAITKLLGLMAIPFRVGATSLNLPFQVSNLLADVPRQALISKYGIRGVDDLVRYPLDLVHALYTSMLGDMFGVHNKLFQDFLESGAAGGTIQEHLTPKALTAEPKTTLGNVAHKVLYALPDFAQAIEQTSKILGIKRAMRFEKVINSETGLPENMPSGKALARLVPEAVTEVRRFSGSPDFGRQGKWVEQARLNLLYMFLNARIQGAVADLGRLTGRDGAGTAAKTWAKVLTAVGLPTAYLYMLNNSSKYAADYAQRPAQEKQNYWLIPKDSKIKAADGSEIRDYWRIPKRESSKWVANMVESGLEFAEKRTPQTFGRFGQSMIEDISPVNIQGNNFQERLESTASSLNPLIKTPLEVATGRDLYRHKNIIPDTMKKATPEQQYTDRTAEVFKTAAKLMPGIAPEAMRSPLMLEAMTKDITAGLITQFLPRKPIEGRSATENTPLLSRFQAQPYTDSTEFDQRMAGLERQSADEQLATYRTAKKALDDNPKADIRTIVGKEVAEHGPDKKLIERTVDLWTAEQRGISSNERRILALPTPQRAQYIQDELKRTPPERRDALLRNFALKRIFTEGVAEEMARQAQQNASPTPTTQ